MNQRIYDVSATWGNGPEPLGFLCECGNPDCQDVLSLSVAEYEAIRARPDSFVFVPGHEEPGVDSVIERTDGRVIVEERLAYVRLAS